MIATRPSQESKVKDEDKCCSTDVCSRDIDNCKSQYQPEVNTSGSGDNLDKCDSVMTEEGLNIDSEITQITQESFDLGLSSRSEGC